MSGVNERLEPAGGLSLRRVERDSHVLLHEQAAASIRRAIAVGEARPGDRIPQAKDLAAVLGVNTNTVLRAIGILKDEGLLQTGRGKAITVSGTPDRSELVTRLREVITLGDRMGYPRSELAQLLEKLS